jgi:3-deoxy-D-manno-octulosonic-acid transferase
MNILYNAYVLIISSLFIPGGLALLFYSYLSGRYGGRLKERFGFLPRKRISALTGSPRVWVHAVSLGEINVSVSIIKAIKKKFPKSSVILSTTTEHGYDLAVKTFNKELPVIYAPIDCIFSVRKALYQIRPHIMIFLETEIWPTWIKEAHQMGAKIAVANGRISKKSFRQYLKLRPLFAGVLKDIDAFSMICNEDAFRVQKMGAEPNKIYVNGNAKYDLLPSLTNPYIKEHTERTFDIDQSQPVFIAGSTREGEEALVLDAYEQILKLFPNLILIIAPRHIKRTQEIGGLLKKSGHRYQLQSRLDGFNNKRKERIVIINTFGELFNLYSIGTIIFCGGSLVPKGGQNPLEAAIWGKVVFYGPFMDNFLDAKGILEKVNAGICVSTPQMLAEQAIWYLKHPSALKKYGAHAREAVINNRNSATKHAQIIADLLPEFCTNYRSEALKA